MFDIVSCHSTDNPQALNSWEQVLSSSSLPKPPPLPRLNHHQKLHWNPANGYHIGVMASMDENERSAKRQKLCSEDGSASVEDQIFFEARLSEALPTDVCLKLVPPICLVPNFCLICDSEQFLSRKRLKYPSASTQCCPLSFSPLRP